MKQKIEIYIEDLSKGWFEKCAVPTWAHSDMVLDSSSENRRFFLDVTALVKVLANEVNSEMVKLEKRVSQLSLVPEKSLRVLSTPRLMNTRVTKS